MKKFNRGGKFGKGGFSRPEGRGPRKFGGGFRGKTAGPRRDSGEDRGQYEATCAMCGAQCQVPFRPSGERPVYCRDCFRKGAGGGQQGPRREERGPRRPFPRREARPAPSGAEQGELVRLLERMNDKLDRIVETLDEIISKGE